MNVRFCWLLLSIAFAGLLSPARAQERQDPQARIEAALPQPTQFDFDERPLADVVEALQDQHRIQAVFDVPAMAAEGISTDAPVTARANGVTLAEGLEQILRPQQLTFIVKYDVLFVTTEAAARRLREVRVYQVLGDASTEALIRKMTATPETWENANSWGRAIAFPSRSIVVLQNPLVHRQIAQELGGAVKMVSPTSRRAADVPGLTNIANRLSRPARMAFIETPLSDVVTYLSHAHRISIIIDVGALQKAEISSDAPLTCNLSRIRLGNALTLALMRFGLTWTVDTGILVITTPEAVDTPRVTAFYEVDDLAQGETLEKLAEIIPAVIAPESWSEVGGAGVLRVRDDGALEVRQPFPVQQEISAFLADLRKAAQP